MATRIGGLVDSLNKYNEFDVIEEKIKREIASEKHYYLKKSSDWSNINLDRMSNYSIDQFATKFDYQPKWLKRWNDKGGEYHDTANEVLRLAIEDTVYKEKLRKRRDDDGKEVEEKYLIREFDDKIYCCLSDRYSIFDDDEILEIIKGTRLIDESSEFWGSVAPQRLHLRFVDKEQFFVGTDKSPLSFCTFIDNSMCGDSSLRVRFGIYRSACTNGMIFGYKSFDVVRECHKGEKEYSQIVASALESKDDYKKLFKEEIKKMQEQNSSIFNMTDEEAAEYIKNKLTVSKKVANNIIDIYHNTYGGISKWDMVNAITEVAHSFNINERLMFEQKSLLVA